MFCGLNRTNQYKRWLLGALTEKQLVIENGKPLRFADRKSTFVPACSLVTILRLASPRELLGKLPIGWPSLNGFPYGFPRPTDHSIFKLTSTSKNHKKGGSRPFSIPSGSGSATALFMCYPREYLAKIVRASGMGILDISQLIFHIPEEFCQLFGYRYKI